uniref:Zona pellucida sperm-binding protein 4 n=1 Tax=Esox lucius TaxID=8010 RepID=A0AAY5KH56_ESOLU
MLGYPGDAQLWKGQKSQFRPRMLPSQDELQQLICNIVDTDKLACGLPSITAARCRAINCCFDGQKCFYGKTATVQCTKDGQFVVVVARDVTLTNLKSIHLLGRNESHCKPVVSSSFAIYQFKFTECGTVISEGVGQIVYENRLSSSYEVTVGPVGAITRDSHYDLLFQCRYTGSSVETVMTELRPVRHPDPVSSLADLNVELRLASGRCLAQGCNEDKEAYTSYYTDADYPITKVLRDPLYVEVRILGMTDPGVVLLLDHCWATTAPQRDSLPQWELLFDGCSFQDDRYMTVPIPVGTTSSLSYPSHYKRFALRMFTFVDPTSMVHLREKVYVHCSTAVCHHQAGSCKQRCQIQNPHCPQGMGWCDKMEWNSNFDLSCLCSSAHLNLFFLLASLRYCFFFATLPRWPLSQIRLFTVDI